MRISCQSDLQVVGQAQDVKQALEKAAELSLDLVIVDISLKDSHGVDLIKQLSTPRKKTRTLAWSMYDESLYAARCLEAGATGYVNKQADPDEMITAIRHVLDGKVYVSGQLADCVLSDIADAIHRSGPSPVEMLTPRELEVFHLIGNGLTNRDIAARLHRSVRTVETHRENIKRKLNLKTAAELVRYAAHWG